MKLISVFFFNIYNNKKLLLTFIFLTSLLFSLIFLIFLGRIGPPEHRIPGTDYLIWYKPIANNILKGEGFLIEGGKDIISPGYPLILSIVFALSSLSGINELQLIVVFNIIMAAAAACFLFLIAESIFDKKIALTTSFLWMSYPFNLWFIKNPNTEVPFILLLYAGIWLYLIALEKKRFGFIFLVGALIGFAALIRPMGLLLPFIFISFIFSILKGNPKRIQLLLVVFLLAGVLITILPWEGYVLAKTGRIIPLSTWGPGAVVDGLTFNSKPSEGERRGFISDDVMGLIERVEAGNLTTSTKILHFAAQELINRPTPFLKLIGWKLVRSWYATAQMWREGEILAVQVIYLLAGLIGIIYGIKFFKDKIREIIFLLSIVFYFWGMTILALSILRYVVPAMGLIIIFSAITVNIIIDKLSKKRFYLKE